MPSLYRSMFADANHPRVGPTATTLGVRVAPNPKPDILVDSSGSVRPGTGGMSVAPTWRLLPPHRIPDRLRNEVPTARGNQKLRCWRWGDGPFAAAPVSPDLAFRPDPAAPEQHGFVEPAREMPVDGYQAALAATREHWVIDEA